MNFVHSISKLVLTGGLLLGSLQLSAQSDLIEYQQEIGGGVGICSYIGDASGFFGHVGAMGTLLWRRNFNPRMTLKTNLAYGNLRGDTEGYFIPTDPMSQTPEGGLTAPIISFNRHLIDVGAHFELNFLGYGLGASYKKLYRWTPYMVIGLGATFAFGGGGRFAAGMNIPLGLGFRYKFAPRWNLGLEWTVRFTTTDRLDDASYFVKLDDPYGIESGFLKNKDSYQMIYVSVTYDIAPKYRKCNN